MYWYYVFMIIWDRISSQMLDMIVLWYGITVILYSFQRLHFLNVPERSSCSNSYHQYCHSIKLFDREHCDIWFIGWPMWLTLSGQQFGDLLKGTGTVCRFCLLPWCLCLKNTDFEGFSNTVVWFQHQHYQEQGTSYRGHQCKNSRGASGERQYESALCRLYSNSPCENNLLYYSQCKGVIFLQIVTADSDRLTSVPLSHCSKCCSTVSAYWDISS